jgi:hypothetical protein
VILMADLNQIFKALDLVREQEEKQRRLLNYNPWADFDKVHKQINAPALTAAAVMQAGPPTRPKLPTMLSARFGVGQGIDSEIVRPAVRPYMDTQGSFVRGADILRGNPAFRSATENRDRPLFKATQALAQTMLGGVPQEDRPFRKAMVSATDLADIGRQLAETNAVATRLFPKGAIAELFRQQLGSPDASHLKALSRIIEREVPHLPQTKSAPLVKSDAWPRAALESQAFASKPFMRHLIEEKNGYGATASLLESSAVQGHVLPIIEPWLRPIEIETTHAEIVEISPEGLAEENARADARLYKQTAEDFLMTEELDHELEHLERIAELLVLTDPPSCEYAALAASKIIRGLADRFWPGKDGERWIFTWKNERRPVEKEHTANRLAAYLDLHFRDHAPSYEHRHLETTLYLVHEWAGAGHHVARPISDCRRAYNNLLMVIAAVARAREIERGW